MFDASLVEEVLQRISFSFHLSDWNDQIIAGVKNETEEGYIQKVMHILQTEFNIKRSIW